MVYGGGSHRTNHEVSKDILALLLTRIQLSGAGKTPDLCQQGRNDI